MIYNKGMSLGIIETHFFYFIVYFNIIEIKNLI